MINLDSHQIVSKNEWIEARKVLLKKEKEFTICALIPSVDLARKLRTN